MNQFIFTKKAEKRFLDLPKSIQKRILVRLKDLKQHEDIFSILKRLYHLEPASHRLRVGNHRLILELREQNKKETSFWVLDVGDRKDIYK